MPYASWSVVFGEQPSAAKWNILGTNDAYFSSVVDATGMPLQKVSTNFSAVATGTTLIPFDDTIPQNTEGDQYMTQVITPKATTNRLLIEARVHVASSVINNMTVALFQDTTANALAAAEMLGNAANAGLQIPLVHEMAAGTTSATTFKIRIGGQLAGTTTFNGEGGARKFGGITLSSITITEYKA